MARKRGFFRGSKVGLRELFLTKTQFSCASMLGYVKPKCYATTNPQGMKSPSHEGFKLRISLADFKKTELDLRNEASQPWHVGVGRKCFC